MKQAVALSLALSFFPGFGLALPSSGPSLFPASSPARQASNPTQTSLEGEAARLAQAWAQGDTRVLEQAMNAEGIRLRLPDEEHLSIHPRQAQAALGSFLGRHEKGETQVARVSRAEGDAEKGFAEVRWATGTSGVSEPMVFTIFFGFELRDMEWRITEIRVLY